MLSSSTRGGGRFIIFVVAPNLHTDMITEYSSLCIMCDKPASEIHHLIFGNGLRELADEDGLYVPLCHDCHEELHSGRNSARLSRLSKIVGQLQWEKEQVEAGDSLGSVRNNFRKRYGKSWL